MTKTRPWFIPIKEFNYYKELSNRYSDFPSIPKFLLEPDENKAKIDAGHRISLVRGFRKRAKNWVRDHLPYKAAQNLPDSTQA